MKPLAFLLFATVLFLSGCATRTIKMPDGTTVSSTTLFVNSGLDKLDIRDSKAAGSTFKANGFKGDENSANDLLLQLILALASRLPAATNPIQVPGAPLQPTSTTSITPASIQTTTTVIPAAK